MEMVDGTTDADETPPRVSETALLSEAALAEDWNRPEEDAAWSYLQPEERRSPQESAN